MLPSLPERWPPSLEREVGIGWRWGRALSCSTNFQPSTTQISPDAEYSEQRCKDGRSSALRETHNPLRRQTHYQAAKTQVVNTLKEEVPRAPGVWEGLLEEVTPHWTWWESGNFRGDKSLPSRLRLLGVQVFRGMEGQVEPGELVLGVTGI